MSELLTVKNESYASLRVSAIQHFPSINKRITSFRIKYIPVLNYAYAKKRMGGRGGIPPRALKLNTKWA
jgi:hypothetical protein